MVPTWRRVEPELLRTPERNDQEAAGADHLSQRLSHGRRAEVTGVMADPGAHHLPTRQRTRFDHRSHERLQQQG